MGTSREGGSIPASDGSPWQRRRRGEFLRIQGFILVDHDWSRHAMWLRMTRVWAADVSRGLESREWSTESSSDLRRAFRVVRELPRAASSRMPGATTAGQPRRARVHGRTDHRQPPQNRVCREAPAGNSAAEKVREVANRIAEPNQTPSNPCSLRDRCNRAYPSTGSKRTVGFGIRPRQDVFERGAEVLRSTG